MEKLTAREKEVLELLIKGLSNPEISEVLTISTYTTKAFLASIYRKLGVANRVQAVIKYLKLKNMDPAERK